MKLREIFSIIYSFIIALLLILTAISISMYVNSKNLVESNITRFRSFEIAEELRKSSDDLTRFCRTYVETGDSVWEKRYWEVLDIRNGIKPRPDGRIISLQDSMKKLGFTKIEFEKLKEAEKNSNELVRTEKIAFNALKGWYSDDSGQFTIQKEPDTNLARTILFDNKYHENKSTIMEPIDDCINMVRQRTKSKVEKKTMFNKWLIYGIVILISVISVISIIAFFLIRNKIILQLEELKTAKENAEKSERKYRLIFDKSPDVITITSGDGYYLDCNKAFLDFHKIKSLDELQDLNILQSYVNIEDREEIVKQLFRDGYIRNMEVTFKSFSDNTKTIDCLVSCELINYEGNELVFMSWIRDITEKKQMENLMLKLSTAISQNPASILITDVAGKIEYVNPQFTKLTGYSYAELDGKTPRILKSGYHSKDFYRKMWETILSGKVWRDELYNKRKDGTFFWEDATFAPILNKKNEIINIVGIKQDITLKKKAEFALIEREKALKELNETKDRLFSIIGHDLRSPIGILKSFINLMLSDYDQTDTKKIKKQLEILYTSTCTTSDLLENLLLWARSQQKEVIFEPVEVNLYDIAEITTSLLAISAKTKNIIIHNNIPKYFTVKADNNMIMAVIRNLIMNGIKFTNNNKNIYLSVTEGNEYDTVCIKDEGIGIKPENIKKLFSPTEIFSNYGTSGEKGTGLGLLLCKEYIEKHGGNIWVESEEGTGSEFKFTLLKT